MRRFLQGQSVDFERDADIVFADNSYYSSNLGSDFELIAEFGTKNDK